MNRVIFLVDGFNLYHSLIEVQAEALRQIKSRGAGQWHSKWLDLSKLCLSFLHIIGRNSSERAVLEKILYFTAPPTHRGADKLARHSLYIQCLGALGIEIHSGRFKKKDVWCSLCKKRFVAHEEKEADVAIATALFKVCHLKECENVVLITGDTDLAPTVRTCKAIFPEINILFGFPYKRSNTELEKIAPNSFSIKCGSILNNQLLDPFILPGGGKLVRPYSW